MDCTIPSHNVKVFSGWVVTLGKIGSSDLYLEFDPLQGLTLRTLNDAKSAYAKVTLDPAFFEVCTEPPSSHDGNKYMCRLSIRTLYSVLKTSRKGLQSLRIRSYTTPNNSNQLSLEFRLMGNYSIYHRLAVQSCDHSIPAAVVEKKGCSEILIAPKLLQSMVEPLKRSHQVALHISHQVISATSFHTHISSSSSNATPGSNFHFKSETTLSCEELQDFYYKDDRTALDNYTENDANNHDNNDNDMPPNVNEDVTLVFGLKELQSMLQFCNKGGGQDNSSTIILYFYWGGKPLIVETEGDAYTAELILATLDYKLLMRVNQNNHTNQITTPSNNNNHISRQDMP